MYKLLRTVSHSCRFIPFEVFTVSTSSSTTTKQKISKKGKRIIKGKGEKKMFQKDNNFINLFFTIARKSNIFANSLESCKILFSLIRKPEGKIDDKLQFRYFMLIYDLLIKTENYNFSFSQDKGREWLQLLKFSILFDHNETRIKSFIKRFIQTLYYTQPNYSIAGILMVHEILVRKPFLRQMLKDLPKENNNKKEDNYDPNEMNPEKSGSDNTKLYELIRIMNHFHPYESKIVKIINEQHNFKFNLINENEIPMFNGKKDYRIKYNGDAISEFSMMGFLEKFIYSMETIDEETKEGEEGKKNDDEEEEEEERIQMNNNAILQREDESFLAKYKQLENEEKEKLIAKISNTLEQTENQDDEDELMEDIENDQEMQVSNSSSQLINTFITKKPTRKTIDFDDNKIEKFFIDSAIEAIEEENEEKIGMQNDDDINEPARKKRKISNNFTINKSHLQNEFQMLLEEDDNEKEVEKEEEEPETKNIQKTSQENKPFSSSTVKIANDEDEVMEDIPELVAKKPKRKKFSKSKFKGKGRTFDNKGDKKKKHLKFKKNKKKRKRNQ